MADQLVDLPQGSGNPYYKNFRLDWGSCEVWLNNVRLAQTEVMAANVDEGWVDVYVRSEANGPFKVQDGMPVTRRHEGDIKLRGQSNPKGCSNCKRNSLKRRRWWVT